MKVSGYSSIKLGNRLRLQYYYPEIILDKTEVFIKVQFGFRLVFKELYKGFAIQVLGFGIGFDYSKQA